MFWGFDFIAAVLFYQIQYNAHFMINFAGFVKEQETKMVRTIYSTAYHIHVPLPPDRPFDQCSQLLFWYIFKLLCDISLPCSLI